LSSQQRNSAPPSAQLIVAPELQGLGITARLCEAYDRLTWEALSLHEALLREVPIRVHLASLHLIEAPKSGSTSKLMPLLKKRRPLLYDYVVKLRSVFFITNLLEGEITEEWLQNKRKQTHDTFTELGADYSLVELFQRPYQKRPRKRPASKSTLYLQALDFKIEHPRTSWGKLAQKFCGSSAKENTLKAWTYGMAKKLAEVGVQISLENPGYSPQRPKPLNVKR